MAGFTVDPDSFGPVAEQLRQAGTELTGAWEPVRAQSQALQFGRGDDVLSPLIQVSLHGAVSLVDSCMQTSATALGGYADGLTQMGRTYQEAEAGTKTMMTPA
jgi:hypothetical protein